ncbi:GTPase-activating Rap/Ran-GAP domain-like protein 3 [Lampetra planeri]
MRKGLASLRKGCSFEIVESSASEDLGSRRGIFSRKHYGSVELLISSDADGAIQRAGRFRVENGSSSDPSKTPPGTWQRTDVHLENPEYHTRWYFKYFLGKVHQNYVGVDMDKSCFFLSVVLSDHNNLRVPQYRAVLWRRPGSLKICLPYCPTKAFSVKSILSAISLDKFERSLREILNPEIQKDLLVLEEQEGSVNFKFGVLYAREGQLTDDEMFSNETGSEDFDKFLGLLGEQISLKGWVGYRGGLDTKNDTTGTHAVYTIYQGHEIMFHVSTMLPYSKDNRQQVERKRHIGNDIVTIVFQEGEESCVSFKPSMIRSHFTHIFALVRFNRATDSYRLRIFSEESVPLFGPPLPTPPVFTDHHEFRDFLLVKLINGEKATLETPTFAQKRQRTLDMLIRSMYQDYTPDLYKNMLNRRSLSDVLPESPRSARKKEEARRAEFVRVGQALKLKTIVRGDAPTSLATTGLCRKEPWEPQCYGQNFPYEVYCADSWRGGLLVSTEAGVLLLHEGQPPLPVLDRSFSVRQMNVIEALDMLVLRNEKGKESRVFVFRLSAVWKSVEEQAAVLGRVECREHKLEKTKGCHLYAVNTHSAAGTLRVVSATRYKLLLATWRRPPGGVTAASPVEEFQYIREICLSDTPLVLTLVDGPTGENDNVLCVAYRHQFDLVSESTGECHRLHTVDASKVNFVAAIDLYEDGEAGLLICFNYTCFYKKVLPFNGNSPQLQSSASDYHFTWNQLPSAIVCAFPYILAFTIDSIEIRLVVNGNLVHTTIVPDLSLISSRSDIFFMASGLVTSRRCSTEHSAVTTPQTPPGDEEPALPPALSQDGEHQPRHIYKIPLSNLVGRSIERPLKSPLVAVATSPQAAPGGGGGGGGAAQPPPIPASHSLPSTRMEIKEIATRTRRELLGLSEDLPQARGDAASGKQRWPRGGGPSGERACPPRSTSSDRFTSRSFESSSSSGGTEPPLSSGASQEADGIGTGDGGDVVGVMAACVSVASDAAAVAGLATACVAAARGRRRPRPPGGAEPSSPFRLSASLDEGDDVDLK